MIQSLTGNMQIRQSLFLGYLHNFQESLKLVQMYHGGLHEGNTEQLWSKDDQGEGGRHTGLGLAKCLTCIRCARNLVCINEWLHQFLKNE